MRSPFNQTLTGNQYNGGANGFTPRWNLLENGGLFKLKLAQLAAIAGL